MSEDWIIVAKLCMTQQSKWSRDLRHSNLTLTGLNEKFDRSDPINRLFRSSPSTLMTVPTVFFKLLFWQTRTKPFFTLKERGGGGGGGCGSVALTWQSLKPFDE